MEDQIFCQALTVKTKEAEEIVYGAFGEYLEGFKQSPYISTILEAMEYSLKAGGKRLRPLLMRECFFLFADENDGEYQIRLHVLEGFMTALEMIHTYSLVHDDLPAMDNDRYRRGKETTWAVYGDGMGVLTGDALLNSAYELALDQVAYASRQGASPALIRTLLTCSRILGGKAGIGGMLGGQVADVEAEKKHLSMTMEELIFIHTNKTAALIESAMMIGALLAGASDGEARQLETVARKVGIAFQIQDDILDVEGDSRELGKPVGSDAENGKETYVTLQGVEEARKEVERLSAAAVSLLEEFPGDSAFLRALIKYLIYRKK